MNQPLLRKIGLGLLLFAALWLLGRYLLPILLPFLLAALLALSAEPLVSFLHDRLRLPRALASGIGVSIALLLAVLLVLTLCALLLRQLGNLSGVLPDLGQTAQEGMESLEGFLINLRKGNITNGVPVVLNIPGRTIGMTAGFTNPVMHIVLTPVTSREQNITTAVLQSKAHAFV